MPAHAPGATSLTREWLEQEIGTVMETWETHHGNAGYWREPLLAVAAADDRLFPELRGAVAEDHAMPTDLLPEARSVVVFFIPFQKRLGTENNEAGTFAARSWAESYVTTNRLIDTITGRFKAALENRGHAVAVTPATHNFDPKRLISRWSHKHIGTIAGLGTFGHNNLLITKAGCCGRLGSFVTSAPFPPTKRPGTEYCLKKDGRKCDACVEKCTYGALHKTAYDRRTCYGQCLKNDALYGDLSSVEVCGKCACNVPCSYRIPPRPE